MCHLKEGGGGGTIVMENEKHELIVVRKTTGQHMYVDYRKLNQAAWKYHFPLPFIDQMLEKLVGIFLLLLNKWLFGLFANSSCLKRSSENYFYMSLWNFFI